MRRNSSSPSLKPRAGQGHAFPENSEKTGKVGPGNPPVETRWKPGQSGNPGGRPKSKLLGQAYREALAKIDPKSGRTVAEVIARALIAQARRGNVKAAIELANRTEGKAPQHIEVGGEQPFLFMSVPEMDERIAELVKKWKAQKSHGGAKDAG